MSKATFAVVFILATVTASVAGWAVGTAAGKWYYGRRRRR